MDISEQKKREARIYSKLKLDKLPFKLFVRFTTYKLKVLN